MFGLRPTHCGIRMPPSWSPRASRKAQPLPEPSVHVQKLLGHRQLSSTQVYVTVSKEELAKSAAALA